MYSENYEVPDLDIKAFLHCDERLGTPPPEELERLLQTPDLIPKTPHGYLHRHPNMKKTECSKTSPSRSTTPCSPEAGVKTRSQFQLETYHRGRWTANWTRVFDGESSLARERTIERGMADDQERPLVENISEEVLYHHQGTTMDGAPDEVHGSPPDYHDPNCSGQQPRTSGDSESESENPQTQESKFDNHHARKRVIH